MRTLPFVPLCIAFVLTGAAATPPAGAAMPPAVAPGDSSAYKIKLIPWETRRYVGAADTLMVGEMSAHFAERYPALIGALLQQNDAMTGPPSGVFWSWDEAGQRSYMAAAIPIMPDATPAGLPTFDVKGRIAITTDHYGGFDGIGAAHEAIDAYLERMGFWPESTVIEEYLTDPRAEPDTTRWHTRILYVLE